MNGDSELVKFLYDNVNMGIEALESMSMELNKTDNKIKSNVNKALETFKTYKNECSKYIKDEAEAKGSIFTTLMSKMGTKMEFMKDNSDSKLAETLIQGYNMGLIDVTKKMKKYKKDTSKEIMKLAENYKNMLEESIESVKGFL